MKDALARRQLELLVGLMNPRTREASRNSDRRSGSPHHDDDMLDVIDRSCRWLAGIATARLMLAGKAEAACRCGQQASEFSTVGAHGELPHTITLPVIACGAYSPLIATA